MVINKTGNRIHRHGPGRAVRNINISEKLVSNGRGHSNDTINIGRVLTYPRIRKGRKHRIIISEVPDVQRLRRLTLSDSAGTGEAKAGKYIVTGEDPVTMHEIKAGVADITFEVTASDVATYNFTVQYIG